MTSSAYEEFSRVLYRGVIELEVAAPHELGDLLAKDRVFFLDEGKHKASTVCVWWPQEILGRGWRLPLLVEPFVPGPVVVEADTALQAVVNGCRVLDVLVRDWRRRRQGEVADVKWTIPPDWSTRTRKSVSGRIELAAGLVDVSIGRPVQPTSSLPWCGLLIADRQVPVLASSRFEALIRAAQTVQRCADEKSLASLDEWAKAASEVLRPSPRPQGKEE